MLRMSACRPCQHLSAREVPAGTPFSFNLYAGRRVKTRDSLKKPVLCVIPLRAVRRQEEDGVALPCGARTPPTTSMTQAPEPQGGYRHPSTGAQPVGQETPGPHCRRVRARPAAGAKNEHSISPGGGEWSIAPPLARRWVTESAGGPPLMFPLVPIRFLPKLWGFCLH